MENGQKAEGDVDGDVHLYPVVDRVDRESRSKFGQVESIEKSSTRSTLESSRPNFQQVESIDFWSTWFDFKAIFLERSNPLLHNTRQW